MRTGGQQQAVLKEQTSIHGIAGIDVLRNCKFHEVGGRDNWNFAGAYVGFVDDAAYAAPMITVRVRVDNGRDGKSLADMLLEQSPRGASDFFGHQWIKDDPSGFAADEGNVGQVEATDLVDARDHL